MAQEPRVINMIIDGKYKIIRKIGRGSYGDVYAGTQISSEKMVAIKLEKASVKQPSIPYEIQIYEQFQNTDGFPQIYYTGKENGYHIIIMELLGPSLDKLFVKNREKFTLKSVLMIADQVLVRLEYLHKNKIIHRDVKPSNLLMGCGDKSNQVYLIDYGLAKRYMRENQHIPFNDKKKYLVGNIAFSSHNSFLHREQSRRDDLESLGYVLMYFLKGTLPWRGIPVATLAEKIKKIREVMLTTSPEVLCEGFPEEFITYFKYCSALKFEEEPDYAYLKQLFRTVAERKNYTYDNVYDWTKT